MQLDSERLRSLQDRLNSMAGPMPEDHDSRNDAKNCSDEDDEGAYEPVGRQNHGNRRDEEDYEEDWRVEDSRGMVMDPNIRNNQSNLN